MRNLERKESETGTNWLTDEDFGICETDGCCTGSRGQINATKTNGCLDHRLSTAPKDITEQTKRTLKTALTVKGTDKVPNIDAFRTDRIKQQTTQETESNCTNTHVLNHSHSIEYDHQYDHQLSRFNSVSPHTS